MLGIIAAMQIEVEAIVQRMQNVKHEVFKNTNFYVGTLNNHEVVVCESGVGKCSSSITTTLLINHFNIEGVINIGTAGGLKHGQKTLDVVVSQKVAQYDVDVPGWDKGFDSKKCAYMADEEFVKLVLSVIEENNDRVWVGNIASGDQFIYRDEQIEYILKNYPDAMCAEMEAGTVAQTCTYFNIPFVVIRSLSDIAIEPSNELTFDEYVQKASQRSAIWCEKFVTKYYQR